MSSERPKQGSQGRGAPGPQPRGNDPGRGALVSRSEELKALEVSPAATRGESGTNNGIDWDKLRKEFKELDASDLPNDISPLISLLVEGKTKDVEDQIEPSKDLQIDMVKWLDRLVLSNPEKVSALLRSHPNESAKASRLYSKSLGLLIKRWIKKFSLDREIAPNHCAYVKRNFLQWFVSKKGGPEMRLENWRDLIDANLQDDQVLQYELLRLLTAGCKDVKEAVYWVKKFNLDHEKIPYAVWTQLQSQEEVLDDVDHDVVERAAGCDRYHRLSLPRDCISFIDDKPGFSKFLEIATADVTAMDLETGPASYIGKPEAAILQLACKNHVYILDMNSLSEILDPCDWEEFIHLYFENPKNLLLVFDIGCDFQVLAKSVSAFTDIKSRAEKVLDLRCLEESLTHASSSLQLRKPNSSEKGLSALVESLLGLPLDKRDQISNWSRRPLRENQVVYAALDAYVLLEVFEALKNRSGDVGASATFEYHVQELIRSKNKTSNKKEQREVDEK